MENAGSYSFYLNVVVINSNDASSTNNDDASAPDLKEETVADSSSPSDGKVAADEAGGEGGAVLNVNNAKPASKSTDDPKLKILMESKALMDFAFNRKRSIKPKLDSNQNDNNDSNGGNSPAKESRGFMKTIGSSISKSSSNISKRASRFMASKTMVSRAEKAVSECIPLVTEEIGVEMSISKRFQQGPVFVLEVDMKGCHWIDLLKNIMGDEAAKHYACVKDGLEFLNLPNAQEAMVNEILPKLRKAMMEKMSEIVPEKMKQKKQYSDLEIQCVALEDAEEAKWLYNFLAFMEEMK